jgi:hypothetical protein
VEEYAPWSSMNDDGRRGSLDPEGAGGGAVGGDDIFASAVISAPTSLARGAPRSAGSRRDPAAWHRRGGLFSLLLLARRAMNRGREPSSPATRGAREGSVR